MRETEIDLAGDLQRFIDREIVEGRFKSPSEVIEAGLLMLQERETRLAALRSLLEESEHAAASPHISKP
jgi:antitoxin ParD1/3/4